MNLFWFLANSVNKVIKIWAIFIMFTPWVLNLGLSSLIGKGAVLKFLITNILIAKIKILCNVLEVYLTYVKLFDKNEGLTFYICIWEYLTFLEFINVQVQFFSFWIIWKDVCVVYKTKLNIAFDHNWPLITQYIWQSEDNVMSVS